MKVSIVTAYYNRRPLFLNTLRSISKTAYPDVEIIVVDDGSCDAHRIDDLPSTCRFPMKVIRVEPKDKWWVNPCIPFNMGIKQATGDVVLLTNPECIHLGDVISHAVRHVGDRHYISYACYALTQDLTTDVVNIPPTEDIWDGVKRIIYPLGNRGGKWYNHKVRPRGYHFLSAITSRLLRKVGGFDEDFARGIGYDDDDFLARIRRTRSSIVITDEQDPFCVHQFHGYIFNVANRKQSLAQNKILFLRKGGRRR